MAVTNTGVVGSINLQQIKADANALLQKFDTEGIGINYYGLALAVDSNPGEWVTTAERPEIEARVDQASGGAVFSLRAILADVPILIMATTSKSSMNRIQGIVEFFFRELIKRKSVDPEGHLKALARLNEEGEGVLEAIETDIDNRPLDGLLKIQVIDLGFGPVKISEVGLDDLHSPLERVKHAIALQMRSF